ncbi:MAG: UDP-N-acetylmuramoyl-L-alanine--D-glutamate ligase [Patescibacteria group bacterium]|nr:UDP-N-acetylmuramoyl-L-alanine--D-glutamate ligase [Patescibacteria group bacterium]
MDFKNSRSAFGGKKIAVIGEGLEGISSAKYLKKHGADVNILDQKQGKDYLENLDKYDLIVRSPGVKISDLEKYVPKGKITSQTRIFMELCPCKIIGVTGTKGKGTTSSLIYEMLKKQSSFAKASGDRGFDVYLGGNIGKPPLEFLDKLNVQSIVVLELSSFQLLDLTQSPHIAVMLMTTSEHLDYHQDVDEYVDAKRNILKFQTENDFAIVNRDYPASNESDIHTNGKVFYVSTERNGYEGCSVKKNAVFLKLNGKEERVIDASQILLPGKHNLENVCAASMAAYLAGVSVQNIAYVLKTFKGLEHRLELVAEVNGVKYYDDSFSTIPETTIAAINAFKNPEILILGGSSKSSNFKELGEVIAKAENIKAIIGIGVEWGKIKSKIKNQKSKILLVEGADSMEKIVKAASKIALPGDLVLLTPACASFDMFKNYKDRGSQFKSEVLKLKTP